MRVITKRREGGHLEFAVCLLSDLNRICKKGQRVLRHVEGQRLKQGSCTPDDRNGSSLYIALESHDFGSRTFLKTALSYTNPKPAFPQLYKPSVLHIPGMFVGPLPPGTLGGLEGSWDLVTTSKLAINLACKPREPPTGLQSTFLVSPENMDPLEGL